MFCLSVIICKLALSTHSKHKRTQLRNAQNRQRKQKSLLCHLKTNTKLESVPIPIVKESSSTYRSSKALSNNNSSVAAAALPTSNRTTRGFRVHIEPRTHTVTRTSKKEKLSSTIAVKQELTDHQNIKKESSPPIEIPIQGFLQK